MRLFRSEHEDWVPPKQRIKRHHATSKGAMTEATGQTNGTKKINTFGSGGSAFQVGMLSVNMVCFSIEHYTCCLCDPCHFPLRCFASLLRDETDRYLESIIRRLCKCYWIPGVTVHQPV